MSTCERRRWRVLLDPDTVVTVGCTAGGRRGGLHGRVRGGARRIAATQPQYKSHLHNCRWRRMGVFLIISHAFITFPFLASCSNTLGEVKLFPNTLLAETPKYLTLKSHHSTAIFSSVIRVVQECMKVFMQKHV